MRTRFVTVLALALLVVGGVVALHTPQPRPAEALSGDVELASITDVNGDCSQLRVSINITDRTADADDDGFFDYYYAAVYSGPDVHATRKLRAPFGSATTIEDITIDEVFYDDMTFRPLRVAVFDVVVPGVLPLSVLEPPQLAVVGEITLDPATLFTSCQALDFFTIDDNRVNTLTDEPWQTAAVYCRSDGGFDVYRVKDGVNGFLAIRVTADEINAVGVQAENAVIDAAADGDTVAYRLSTGEFQVNASTATDFLGYVVRWDGCPSLEE